MVYYAPPFSVALSLILLCTKVGNLKLEKRVIEILLYHVPFFFLQQHFSTHYIDPYHVACNELIAASFTTKLL